MKVSADHIALKPLGFIERQHHRLAGAAQLARDEVVLRSQPCAGIHHEDQTVGLLHSLFGLQTHLSFESRWMLDQSAGIDQYAWNLTDTRVTVLPIARHARHIGHNRRVAARQGIKQRGLADIRPPDDRNDRQHGTFLMRYVGRSPKRAKKA